MMKRLSFFVCRHCICAVALLLSANVANAATGIRELDTPALAVRQPASVFLDAITRAGNRLVAGGEHGVITYSDDNGQHWLQARVPVSVTITALAFVNADDGWAAGNSGIILHSADGGKTWQEQMNGPQANALMLSAAKLAVQQNNPSVGTTAAVRRAEHLIAQGPAQPFLCIFPVSASQAMIFGAFRMAMRTDDGGKTWVDMSLAIGDPVSHHLYDTAEIAGSVYIVGEAGLVFRSTDGDKTFPAITPAGDATLFGALGTGDGGVLVYGVAGRVFWSVDQGKNWTEVAMPQSANITSAISLKNGEILATAESGVIYLSDDHGRTFRVAESLPMAAYAAAQTVNGSIVVTGNHGIMVLTDLAARNH